MGKKRGKRNSKKPVKKRRDYNLPLELWAEILARLPAKTLIELRFVSDDWKSLIESPNFASLHLNLCKSNRENTPLFLIEQGCSKVGLGSIRCSETFRRMSRFDLPNYFVDLDWAGGNYVNGVILLRILDSDTDNISFFIMWNPCIGKYVEIHPPCPFAEQEVRVGFGFDSGSHDFKVVVMVCEQTPWRDCPAPKPNRVPFPVMVHVYSLKTRGWRSFEVETQWFKSLRFEDRTVFFNGCMHWIGCDVSMVPYPLYGSHVVTFDVKSEVFNNFGLPDGRAINRSRILTVLGESLAMLDLYPGCSLIWVMEKYGVGDSWVQRFKIDLEYEEFLHFKRNGEFFVTVIKEGVKMYNIKSKEIKDLARSYRDRVIFMDSYVESLMMLLT